MPLSINDFISQVREEVEFLFESYSYTQESRDWPFAQWALQLLFPLVNPDQAFNLLTFDETSSVIATYRDDESGTFYLLHARYSEDPEGMEFGPGLIYGLLDTYKKISSDSASLKDSDSYISEAASAVEDGYTLSVIFVLFGTLDSSVSLSTAMETYKLEEQQLDCWDVYQLRRLYAGIEEEVETKSIVFPFTSYARYSTGPVEALVGNVMAYEFKKAIQNIGQEIYDFNLRTPLGATKVNKQMMETLEKQGNLFWYYNNGITMLCRGFEPQRSKSKSSRKKIIIIDSPRIVNGAQTSHAILSNEFEKDDQVSVMVRVIAALPGSRQVSEEVSDNPSFLADLYLDIAKYTNSQNAIRLPDFRSNEIVQKDLHEKFRELGWFYEHRRGQWRSITDKRKYKGRIEMVDLAQRWFAFDGNPAIAIRQKASLFEDQGSYGSIFMLSRSADEYLVGYFLFGQIQDRLRKEITKAKEEERKALEADVRVPYRARAYLMIGRATKLATAHMTALLGLGLYDQYGPLNRKLAQEILPRVESGELINDVYAELADTLFRTTDQLQEEKYKTLHQLLSKEDTLEQLYDTFSYVLEREKERGRDVLAIE
ncbi:AIPR family protein [Chloroflexota bacterium]